METPIQYVWQGDAFTPANAAGQRACDRAFVVGERYNLVRHEVRSDKSHAHYFAAVHDAWETLPDHLAEHFPSDEHLRAYCLIRAGFCDSTSIVASSKAEAARVAAFIRPMDGLAVVTVEGPVVTRYVARSQSYRAMAKEDFQRSKEAVFDQIAILLGTGDRRAA